MRRRLLLTATLAAVACRPAPAPSTPKEVEDRLARIEERLDRLTGVNADNDVPATPDIRMMRLEQRLEKIVTFLKAAVPPTIDQDKMYAIPVDPLDPVIGPADAAVTIIEAYEYLCPYCAMVEPKIEELRAKYPTQLRTVSKYFVIHGEPAIPSGRAACAAARQGQNKFAALDDALWRAIWPEVSTPARDQASAESVARMAKLAGLDMKRFKADLDGPCAEWISTNARVLQSFGAGGTPSFWINGRPVEAGTEMGPVIEEELARVKESGVAPGTYYQDVVMAKGATEAIMISPFD